jgi:hypothetical protein
MLTGRISKWGLEDSYVICVEVSDRNTIVKFGKTYKIEGNVLITHRYRVHKISSGFIPAVSLAKLLYGVEDV